MARRERQRAAALGARLVTLADAGYPDGFDTEFMPTSFYEETVRSAQVLQAQLSQIGINADKELMAPGNRPIEIVDGGKVLDSLLAKKA